MASSKTQNKKALVIYHRVDYDGLLSGALAKIALENSSGYNVKYLGYNYGDTFSVDTSKYEKVVMVDISFNDPKMMIMLKEIHGDNLIWIDHHVTAIENSIKYGYDDIPGRRFNGKAACHLTYEYFYHPDKQFGIGALPDAFGLIAAYDIWDHSTYNWDGMVLPFQYGLSCKFSKNIGDFEKYVKKCLDENNKPFSVQKLGDILQDGRCVQKYISELHRDWVSKNSFEVTVDDKYTGIAMISPMSSSIIFNSIADKGYDFYIVIEKAPKTKSGYIISMYSDKNDLELSAGEYMMAKYNGGGHKCAAGGKMTEEQFINIIKTHTV